LYRIHLKKWWLVFSAVYVMFLPETLLTKRQAYRIVGICWILWAGVYQGRANFTPSEALAMECWFPQN